ncbi:DNA-methyltransferase [Proteus penneri]|uniref:Methyltransferase n=1 Tax=Proteus penneri TaxID=102862 RepID=A0ABS0W6L1_9GAMM|nr:site-specific DNA-methyltransferase [Proteus penneri]MBJ2118944.1 site-specific DNA-methyltransferase [Proteus penneri]
MQLFNDDALSVLKTLPENSIDLIATDPPYFRVKSCAWDNQWDSVEAYLSWLDEVLAEFWRVLKPNGSLYLFCGSKLASDTELLVRGRFNVLSHIIWAKPSDMMEHIIRSSSREGDLVADFFMGSGATLKAALKLNRKILGVELEKERFEQTREEINNMKS